MDKSKMVTIITLTEIDEALTEEERSPEYRNRYIEGVRKFIEMGIDPETTTISVELILEEI